MAIPYAGLVYMASRVAVEPGVYPLYFYVGAILLYALHQVCNNLISFLANMFLCI